MVHYLWESIYVNKFSKRMFNELIFACLSVDGCSKLADIEPAEAARRRLGGEQDEW